MILNIEHTSTYAYDAPVNYALQQVRLTPVSDRQQTVENWVVEIEGGKEELSFIDQHGNHTKMVSMTPGETSIKISARGTINTHDENGVLGKVYGPVPLWHFLQPTERTTPGKLIKQLAKGVDKSDQLASLHALSASILERAPYSKEGTYVETSAEEALVVGNGVCQDHAQIFIAAARYVGIPARYVSGYLMINGRIEQEATHAWAEAHLDGLGWVGFDVSNRISPDERYVRIATGTDSKEAAPISGIRFGSATESMIVSLQVQQ